jgi:23S rRNA pseudouridine1911/1915/1917 synthase
VRLIVDPREAGSTVEALLVGRGGLPPKVFREVLSRGGITVNRRRVARGSDVVQPRDEVVAHVLSKGEPPRAVTPIDRSRVLFLDDQLIAVNKPPGVAAQGTEQDAKAGLDAAVEAFLKAEGLPTPFVGLVHRLDLETSGVTVFGRTAAAVTALTNQFREGEVRKRYIALVAGRVPWESRTVDAPIAADASRQGAYCVSPRGRPAVSDFHVLKRFGESDQSWAFTQVEVFPHTGRTHQIRVHSQSLGHALLGDRRYGGPEALTGPTGIRLQIPRVALHAAEIWLRHPAGHELHIEAPWPDDLVQIEREWARVAGSGSA